jgi:hypothetical protein
MLLKSETFILGVVFSPNKKEKLLEKNSDTSIKTLDHVFNTF